MKEKTMMTMKIEQIVVSMIAFETELILLYIISNEFLQLLQSVFPEPTF